MTINTEINITLLNTHSLLGDGSKQILRQLKPLFFGLIHDVTLGNDLPKTVRYHSFELHFLNFQVPWDSGMLTIESKGNIQAQKPEGLLISYW